jgi:hypothetical protein
VLPPSWELSDHDMPAGSMDTIRPFGGTKSKPESLGLSTCGQLKLPKSVSTLAARALSIWPVRYLRSSSLGQPLASGEQPRDGFYDGQVAQNAAVRGLIAFEQLTAAPKRSKRASFLRIENTVLSGDGNDTGTHWHQ